MMKKNESYTESTYMYSVVALWKPYNILQRYLIAKFLFNVQQDKSIQGINQIGQWQCSRYDTMYVWLNEITLIFGLTIRPIMSVPALVMCTNNIIGKYKRKPDGVVLHLK